MTILRNKGFHFTLASVGPRQHTSNSTSLCGLRLKYCLKLLCKTVSVHLSTRKHQTDWSHPLLILKYPKAVNDVAHCAQRKIGILNFIRYIMCSTRMWNCHFVRLIRSLEVGGHNAQKNFLLSLHLKPPAKVYSFPL